MESCSSFGRMYFGKCRASRINLFWSPLNFADDVVRGGDSRKQDVFKNWSDTLFVNLD